MIKIYHNSDVNPPCKSSLLKFVITTMPQEIFYLKEEHYVGFESIDGILSKGLKKFLKIND